MTSLPALLLDSDVFIAAKNSYYAFDICPGFWKGLLHQHRQGRVFSISRVRGELLTGRKTEDLVEWVSRQVPDEFFLEVDGDKVTSAYTEIIVGAAPYQVFRSREGEVRDRR